MIQATTTNARLLLIFSRVFTRLFNIGKHLAHSLIVGFYYLVEAVFGYNYHDKHSNKDKQNKNTNHSFSVFTNLGTFGTTSKKIGSLFCGGNFVLLHD